MRTCMYCGKELKEGERCDCYMSRQRRGETDTAQNTDKDENKKEKEKKKTNNTSYKTGYAGSDNRFERARDRYRAKKEARKNAGKSNFWSDLWHYILCAVKNPVDAVTNPRHISKGALLLISVLCGVILWICAYFISRGGAIGPVRIAASFMGFGEGWTFNLQFLAVILSGAVGGIISFFIYTGIFYFVSRVIIRSQTPYWQFCQRIVTAWIPAVIICLCGSILGIFSFAMFVAIVICGAAALVALTYEGLKTEWINASPQKVFLSMLLGFFAVISVATHITFI